MNSCSQSEKGPISVIAFGDPVLDVVSHVSHEALGRLNLQAGGCVSISAEEMQQLLSLPEVGNDTVRVPGGSAANVAKCLAGLSRSPTPSYTVNFTGMVGKDVAGAEYKRMLQAHGVHPLLAESISGKATAMCLCLVTPDGQRTMRTYLGAALDMQKAAEGFPPSNLSLCHFEGYSLYRPGVAVGAMRTVRTAGGRVSLDLASFEVVRNCWKALKDILEAGLVDILFCNEDEAVALGDVAGLLKGEGSHPSSIESHYDGKASTIEAVCGYFLQFVSVVVISRGKDGCTAAARGGHRASVTAADVAVKDTVGAGDFFSAGFLHAWLQNAPLETCARCGCAAGAAAVQATGAELGPTAMQQLQQTVVELLQQSNGGAGTLQP